MPNSLHEDDVVLITIQTSRSGSLKEQVGRLGYHFPSAVVEQARQSLGATSPEPSTVRSEPRNTRYSLRKGRRNTQSSRTKDKQITQPRVASVGIDMDQSEIDSRAAIAIRELFPKIPEEDVHIIVAQAFQKVCRLLKSHGYLDARAIVEPLTLDKVLEWRDEKDDADAVEDILREVIVISDDEDDDIDEYSLDDRDSSVEIAPSREISHDVHVQPIDYSTLDQRSRFERPVSPEEDWAPAVKFIRRLSPAPSQEHQDRIARHHAQRYQKWQEAIDRSRQKDAADRRQGNLPKPMDLSEAGRSSSIEKFRQPINANRYDDGFLSRSIGPKPVYEHEVSGQPSGKGLYMRDRAGVNDRRENFESLQARPEKYQTQDTTLTSGATFGLRPTYQVHRTRQHVDGDRQIPQHPGGIIQRPSFSQSTYYEPDKPIPSVERDLYPPETQQQYTRVLGKAAEQRQLQDRYLGPRIVELDDDPASPVHKRRRISDEVIPPSKVMYSPRRMELVPIARRVHHIPNHGPSGGSDNGDVPQRSGLASQEHHVPGAFPYTRSEYRQHAPPPIQSQPRFTNPVPASHMSHMFHSGHSRLDDGSGRSLRPLKHRFPQEPTRLEPPHPVVRNAKQFAY
ncbi:MAG: hypothetical protein Q9208_002144, partial [Pyrenodesmia sp. 3 TL-2023]